MLDRKWCNSARGMIASVIGRALTHQFWSVVLSILTLLPPAYACSRSTISKLVLFLPVPLSPFFLSPSLLSPIFSILFYLPDSSLLFLLATLEHVLFSYSS